MNGLVEFWKRVIGTVVRAFHATRRSTIRFLDGPYADEIVRPREIR